MNEDAIAPVSTSVGKVKHSGSTHQLPRRRLTTFGLWAFGILAILSSLLSLFLMIIVPLFSLENELWRRADNPHTFANVVLYAAIGAVVIFAARSSDRVRFWILITLFVAYIVYGLHYELGMFGG